MLRPTPGRRPWMVIALGALLVLAAGWLVGKALEGDAPAPEPVEEAAP